MQQKISPSASVVEARVFLAPGKETLNSFETRHASLTVHGEVVTIPA